jgi:hypothetical protein
LPLSSTVLVMPVRLSNQISLARRLVLSEGVSAVDVDARGGGSVGV